MKRDAILYICIALILAATIGGILLLKTHQDSLLTVDTDPEISIESYLPFQPNDESNILGFWKQGFWDANYPPEKKITGDFPVLNGSKHFFSIYSGIVNALYPSTTELNDDCFRLSTSADAFRSLVDGETDIFFGFEPSPEMIAYAESKGVELELTPIAEENILIILSPENPVMELSREQLVGIFSGTVTNWSEVGGNDEPILVYLNPEGSDAQWAMETVMNGIPLTAPQTELRFSLDKGFYEDTALYRNHSNAIGFTISGIDKPRDTVNRLSFHSRKDPDTGEWIHDYFYLGVYAITRADNDNPNVQTVLDWITSPYGQYMVMWSGFGNIYYDYWMDDGPPVIDTAPSIQVQDYMPFREETKIVKLDHEASLQLVDFLPRIDGAAAVFPVYSAFVNAVYPVSTRFYNNDYTDLESLPGYYFFNYSNTVKGYQYLAQKNTDIFFGGYPSDAQIAYAEENDTEFVYTPIGYDAFVFFVHKDNPINSLTSDQVRGIYSGQITNWNQVGGHDEEIVAYQRNEGSGSQSRLIRFMGDTPLMEPLMDTRIDDMMGITSKVAQFRSSTASIGFSFRYYMEALVANPDLKLLSIDGIAPTAENIANGTYPLTGYLYAVSWEGNENENVQKLLDWILSPEGQYIIAETGYVPIVPTE